MIVGCGYVDKLFIHIYFWKLWITKISYPQRLCSYPHVIDWLSVEILFIHIPSPKDAPYLNTFPQYKIQTFPHVDEYRNKLWKIIELYTIHILLLSYPHTDSYYPQQLLYLLTNYPHNLYSFPPTCPPIICVFLISHWPFKRYQYLE